MILCKSMELMIKNFVKSIVIFHGTAYNNRTGVRKNYLSGGIDMNDIMGSPAFQEFLQKRCEEITEMDDGYRSINNQILQLENEIASSAPNEFKKKIKEYEKLNLDLLTHTMPLIYKRALRDSKNIGG
jgi:hypothetical protein